MDKPNHLTDSELDADKERLVPPQFTIGFLFLLMIVTAVGGLGIRRMLLAWETPSQRVVLVLMTAAIPGLMLIIVSLFAWFTKSFSDKP